jgi:glycosyltransferase involved in cell wall biosynthesis
MEIAILISGLRGGGAERVCVTIANELAARGNDVSLKVLDTQGAVYLHEVSRAVRVEEIGASHARSSLIPLARWLVRKRPCLVLVFGHQLAIVLLLLRTILRSRFKIVARNINTLSKERSQLGFWHGTIVDGITRLFYRRVDHAIAQSNGMQKDLIEYYGFPSSRVTTIYNPVAPSIRREVIKRGIKDGPGYILYVGRLAPQKGLDDLLTAFQIVVTQIKGVRLILAGNGPEEARLQKNADELGISDAVDFIGFQKNIAHWYSHACVVVLTSYYEGFPNVLVEAITCGTPVVAFDCPSGPSEIIVEKQNGILIPGRNVHQFAEALVNVLCDRIVFDPERVRRTAERFNTEKVVEHYEQVLLRTTVDG